MNLYFDELYLSPHLFNLSSIISLRSWQNIYYFHWKAVSLHLAELERFNDLLDKPIMLMSMREVHLLSGTWAEALDILRRKSTNYSELRDPLGAECEMMSTEEKKAVFDKPIMDRYAINLADQYIRGYINQNP